ncbi:protein-disulfide reductase DsbD family protein [Muricoccus radiodurans]|uniref:protein-disulfide reductase DsbD family protein n=1 Tax=Muricoccus radiodurans TaxID=2231721 RepID=UPI003CF6A5DA
MRAFLLLLALLAPLSARALESEPVASPRARATLVADAAAVAPGATLRVGLRLALSPGWHTYWSNPGDAGEPPSLELSLPDGGTAGAMAFPAPRRIPYGPLVNFGYTGEAVFPLAVTVPANAEPGRLYTVEGTARWLVCEQVCIPEEGAFRLDIPVEAATRPDPVLAALFRTAESSLPVAAPFQVRAGFAGTRGAIELAGADLRPGAVREAFFFPDAPGVIDNAVPQALSVGTGALTLALARGAARVPDRLSGVVAVTDAAGVRAAYAVSAVPGPVPAAPGMPLWQAALLAALGGLILNLMPCVFPVLAMKGLGLVRLSGASRGAVRAGAGAAAAGVVVTFLVVGGALIGLRAAGHAAGWGFQFTEPAFVAALAWLMLAIGLNLSGVYAVRGPSGGGALSSGLWGRFGGGVLAVVVATPCTAPFMAAAIGAALAMPAVSALGVFGAMGLGMAAPLALLAVAPGLARLLPRPGAWMERLRGALAFPMYGAAAWLAWVLSVQAGPDGLLALLAGAVLIGFGAWALGVAQAAEWRFGKAVAGVAVIAALALLPRLSAAPATAVETADAWSGERVAALRAEGRPVFVNLTAAWCITCKVNERVALASPAVREAFSRGRVAVLTGDWTRGDPAISALLRSEGREGVPLYLLYPPGREGGPVVLPQILTEGILVEALSSVRPLPVPSAAAEATRRAPGAG